MKKLNAVLMAASLALFILGNAQAQKVDNISDPVKDIWTQSGVGSTNTAVAIDKDGRLNMPKGIINVPYYYSDIAAKSQVGILQSVDITSDSLVTNGTTYLTLGLIQPGIPRNISVVFTSFSLNGIAITSANVTGLAYIYGINSVGVSTNEILPVCSTANAAVGVGNVAWLEITSVTVKLSKLSTGTIVGEVSLRLCIGTGDKIGLWNKVISTDTRTGDIIQVIENGSNSTTYSANPVYGTITFASTPNTAIDCVVVHKVKITPE